jgi:hypothetical protein
MVIACSYLISYERHGRTAPEGMKLRALAGAKGFAVRGRIILFWRTVKQTRISMVG